MFLMPMFQIGIFLPLKEKKVIKRPIGIIKRTEKINILIVVFKINFMSIVYQIVLFNQDLIVDVKLLNKYRHIPVK